MFHDNSALVGEVTKLQEQIDLLYSQQSTELDSKASEIIQALEARKH